jgi:tripartite-type tricarboxylate transporter receptor subunit TctC
MIAKERTLKNFLPAALLVLGLAPLALQGQQFPAKPVHMVTEFSPGSGGDLLIRVVAAPMGEMLGQPVIIENRGGAGGVIAAETVIRAAPDGYTILAATPNALIARRFLARSQSFDVTRDLQPITAVGETTTVVVANPGAPVKTFKELIDYGKANPGKLSYGTSGVGSTHHLSQEQVRMLTGAEIVHVPYKSGLFAIQDVASGQIPISYSILSSGASFIKSGKVRVLAQVGERRSAGLPDVVAIGEVVPGFETPPSWTAFFGPVGMPQAVLRRLNGDAVKAINRPDIKAKLADIGFEPIANSPQEFAAMIKRQIELVGRIVKGAAIQPTD